MDGNPEDRFSRVKAHVDYSQHQTSVNRLDSLCVLKWDSNIEIV